MITPGEAPSPVRVFEALNSYHRTFALKAAIELDLFAHVGAGTGRVAEIAARTGASDRGIRILCDYLAINGFLIKEGDAYSLPPDVALFLDSRSPACVGSGIFFLAHPTHVGQFADLAAAVRKGGTAHGHGNLEPSASIWVEFARWMAPLATMTARALAEVVNRSTEPMKVLDVAAGHGAYGIELARLNPRAEIYAQDWPNVLELARENARAAGVAGRYHTIPGDAFHVELGTGYQWVLLPNFLHHFDHAANVALLSRVRRALAPDGRVATVEFVPDDDRTSPAVAAAFSLTMLASTEHGDAYTRAELDAMFRDAGFGESQAWPIGPQTLIVTQR
jgi:ubiquinone/menaquinone biosynthesis C-methylase UbiE